MAEHRNSLNDYLDFMKSTGEGLENAHGSYFKDIVEPATRDAHNKIMSKLVVVIKENMLPVLDATPDNVEKMAEVKSMFPPLTPLKGSSQSVQKRARDVEDLYGSPKEQWEKLESIWIVVNEGLGDIDAIDAEGVKEIYDSYFD